MINTGWRMIVGATCTYEVFALATGKVPTISAWCRKHRSLEAVILLGLITHFHYEFEKGQMWPLTSTDEIPDISLTVERTTVLRSRTTSATTSQGRCPAVTPDADGTPWGMDGNNQYGDCGVAGINHGFMAAASAVNATAKEQWPADEDIVTYYLSYTGGKDTGVVLAHVPLICENHISSSGTGFKVTLR